MRLEAFITDLLFDHDCVIIPGFGGLVANYRPARLNKVSHVIKPPSKHVGFNRNLTQNDGLLSHHVARIMGVSYAEASSRIAEEVSSYISKLASGDRLVFERIGIFFRDRSGNTQFIPEDQENFLPDSFGLQALQLRPVAAVNSSDREEKDVIPIEKSNGTVWWKVAAAVAIPIALAGTFLLNGQLKNGGELHLASLNPLAQMEKKSEFTPRTSSPVISLKEADMSSGILKLEKESPTLDKVYYDFLSDRTSAEGIEVILKKEEIESVIPAPKVVSTSTKWQGKIAVIGGAFAVHENADNFVREMKSKGFSASIVGLHKGLHLVALGTFSSNEEAIQLRNEARNQAGLKAWIYRK